ncbi:hypothetical protein OPQ81_004032 [Rhizoctonia solani]|nr:hypothetical protein OPQ81_004032 [Rhizoctonia solani]
MQDELRESHFEAVVIGTGLTQSIVAAALAAANKPIIHLDESETYGGPHASLALSELSSFNPTFHPSLVSRQYSLSLTPHLIPATGPFIAALVNSGVSRYGSFVLPKRVVVRTQEGFKNVPANKQDVFRDKAIGLVQKRRLIKFLMFASGEFEGSSELNERETTPLLEFVQDVFGIDKDLAEALSYAVAFCTDAKDQTLPALLRTRTYLRSVGRYGPSPFLIGHYGGAGELAQGFCRTCAVGGGTFVLGRKVLKITRHEGSSEEAKEGNETTHRSWTTPSGKTFTSYHPPATFEGYGTEGVEVPTQEPKGESQSRTETEAEPRAQTGDESKAQTEETQSPTPTGPYFRIYLEGFAAPFTARMVIGSETWLANILDTPNRSDESQSDNPNEPKLSNTIRAILITDAPATFAPPASDQSPPSDEPAAETKLDESIIIFPSEDGAVSVLVNGASTMSCPDGKCILYFAAQSSQDPKEYFAKYISAVLDACSPRPEVWGEVYWREHEIDRIIVRHADQSLQPLPREEETHSYSTAHLTEGSDAAARQAERVFWDALGEQPGEDGKGKDGVEFFARIQRDDDLFDD